MLTALAHRVRQSQKSNTKQNVTSRFLPDAYNLERAVSSWWEGVNSKLVFVWIFALVTRARYEKQTVIRQTALEAGRAQSAASACALARAFAWAWTRTSSRAIQSVELTLVTKVYLFLLYLVSFLFPLITFIMNTQERCTRWECKQSSKLCSLCL